MMKIASIHYFFGWASEQRSVSASKLMKPSARLVAEWD
jgi:hypothetical protein